MSMDKVVHAAVRRDLGRFVDALASLGPGGTTRAGELEPVLQGDVAHSPEAEEMGKDSVPADRPAPG